MIYVKKKFSGCSQKYVFRIEKICFFVCLFFLLFGFWSAPRAPLPQTSVAPQRSRHPIGTFVPLKKSSDIHIHISIYRLLDGAVCGYLRTIFQRFATNIS